MEVQIYFQVEDCKIEGGVVRLLILNTLYIFCCELFGFGSIYNTRTDLRLSVVGWARCQYVHGSVILELISDCRL